MIDEMIELLRSQCEEYDGRVESSTNTGALERTAYPLAIIYQATDTPDAAHMSGGLILRSWAIQITVESATALELLIKNTIKALHGVQLIDCATPLKFSGGKMENIAGSLLQWSLDFEAMVAMYE